MLSSEALERTYFAIKGGNLEFHFQDPVYAEIGKHGKEKRYTAYSSCFVLNEAWVISFGRIIGRYSEEDYDCDLAVIPIDLEKTVEDVLLNNTYFFYSPIFCYSSGGFAVRKESFFSSRGMIEVVTKLGSFEITKGDYDEGIVEHLKSKILNILA